MERRLTCRWRARPARRVVLAPVMFLLLLIGSACGQVEGSPPVLTDLRYPDCPAGICHYQAGFNDGTAVLRGSATFEDPDGDVVLLAVSWQDCGRGDLKKIEIVQKDLRNETSGSLPFIIMIRTDCPPADYTVRVSASDGQGNTSNVLVGSYRIYE